MRNYFNGDQYINDNIVSESAWSNGKTAGISVAGVFCPLLLAALAFRTLKKHVKKNHLEAERRAEEDANPVYGLYECDPDPQAEVQDTNDYYDAMYEEGTAVTKDNNSEYEFSLNDRE